MQKHIRNIYIRKHIRNIYIEKHIRNIYIGKHIRNICRWKHIRKDMFMFKKNSFCFILSVTFYFDCTTLVWATHLSIFLSIFHLFFLLLYFICRKCHLIRTCALTISSYICTIILILSSQKGKGGHSLDQVQAIVSPPGRIAFRIRKYTEPNPRDYKS